MSAEFLLNSTPAYRQPLLDQAVAHLGMDAAESAQRALMIRPDHAATPLVELPALAASLGVSALYVKDEGGRLGLGSFKALGGSFAVVRLALEAAQAQLGHPIAHGDLHTPVVRAVTSRMTMACATDGNHGRSVAAGAALVGARAVVFVHEGVSTNRHYAIARLGAEVVRVPGTYDDSVAEAARVSGARGWTLVSDTARPGFERVPWLVMQGYTPMAHEILLALPSSPTHVFVQAGVGGLAAALAGHFALVLGAARPAFVVVEPARAACLLASARAGHIVTIPRGEPTVMAMLECYEPSLAAWQVLERCADAFMTVDEPDAIEAMRTLARPSGRDTPIVAGESGGVGLAGLVRAARDPDVRAALQLTSSSRALVINTEGATDPERYEALVGAASEAVGRSTRLPGS
jgi:diaminopropionate ammonia-lyase